MIPSCIKTKLVHHYQVERRRLNCQRLVRMCKLKVLAINEIGITAKCWCWIIKIDSGETFLEESGISFASHEVMKIMVIIVSLFCTSLYLWNERFHLRVWVRAHNLSVGKTTFTLSVSFELNTICIKQSQAILEWPGYLVITKTCIPAEQSLSTSHALLSLSLSYF